MYHDFDYERTLTTSLRAQWQLDDVLRADQNLDFSRGFMPESLARTAALGRHTASRFPAAVHETDDIDRHERGQSVEVELLHARRVKDAGRIDDPDDLPERSRGGLERRFDLSGVRHVCINRDGPAS